MEALHMLILEPRCGQRPRARSGRFLMFCTTLSKFFARHSAVSRFTLARGENAQTRGTKGDTMQTRCFTTVLRPLPDAISSNPNPSRGHCLCARSRGVCLAHAPRRSHWNWLPAEFVERHGRDRRAEGRSPGLRCSHALHRASSRIGKIASHWNWLPAEFVERHGRDRRAEGRSPGLRCSHALHRASSRIGKIAHSVSAVGRRPSQSDLHRRFP